MQDVPQPRVGSAGPTLLRSVVVRLYRLRSMLGARWGIHWTIWACVLASAAVAFAVALAAVREPLLAGGILVGVGVAAVPIVDVVRAIRAKNWLRRELSMLTPDQLGFLKTLVEKRLLMAEWTADELPPRLYNSVHAEALAGILKVIQQDDKRGKPVLEALMQPSLTGRMRYFKDVTSQPSRVSPGIHTASTGIP